MRQLQISKSITSRDTRSLERYMTEIGKYDLLTPEQEFQIASGIQAGEEGKIDELVVANLRFVISVAKQYQNQGLSLSDLINEGNIGLQKAAKRFDPTKGFKFISYAVWWIRQSILQAIAENSRIVRVPLNKVGSINKISKGRLELTQLLERIPNEEEIADHLAISVDEVERLEQLGSRHISLDAPMGSSSDSDLTLHNIMEGTLESPETLQIQASCAKDIKTVLTTLSTREQLVLSHYYGLNGLKGLENLERVGDEMGLTRERVRQIKEKAIRKLRRSPHAKLLLDYLRT